MEIKVFILLAVLATILASVNSEDDFIVEVLSPRGFRVSTENFPGIQRVGFRGNINTELLRHEHAEYTGDFALHSNNWWVYENPSASLNSGDTLYYRPQILSRTSGVLSFARQYYVPINTPSISTSDNDVDRITEDEIKSINEESNTAQQFDGPINMPTKPTVYNDLAAINEQWERTEDDSQPLHGEVNGGQQFNGPTEIPSASTTDADVVALNEKSDRTEDDSQPLDGEVNGGQQFNGPTEIPLASTTDANGLALNENWNRTEDDLQPLDGEVNGGQQPNGPTDEIPLTSTTDVDEGLDEGIAEEDEYLYDTEY